MLFSEWCRCNIHQQGATESESFQQNLDPSVVWVSKKIKIKHTLKKKELAAPVTSEVWTSKQATDLEWCLLFSLCSRERLCCVHFFLTQKNGLFSAVLINLDLFVDFWMTNIISSLYMNKTISTLRTWNHSLIVNFATLLHLEHDDDDEGSWLSVKIKHCTCFHNSNSSLSFDRSSCWRSPSLQSLWKRRFEIYYILSSFS